MGITTCSESVQPLQSVKLIYLSCGAVIIAGGPVDKEQPVPLPRLRMAWHSPRRLVWLKRPEL